MFLQRDVFEDRHGNHRGTVGLASEFVGRSVVSSSSIENDESEEIVDIALVGFVSDLRSLFDPRRHLDRLYSCSGN